MLREKDSTSNDSSYGADWPSSHVQQLHHSVSDTVYPRVTAEFQDDEVHQLQSKESCIQPPHVVVIFLIIVNDVALS